MLLSINHLDDLFCLFFCLGSWNLSDDPVKQTINEPPNSATMPPSGSISDNFTEQNLHNGGETASCLPVKTLLGNHISATLRNKETNRKQQCFQSLAHCSELACISTAFH